jgi:hypothetical protein
VHAGADTLLAQGAEDAVAVVDLDDEEVVDLLHARRIGLREDELDPVHGVPVAVGGGATFAVPPVQERQLHTQEGGLQIVEARRAGESQMAIRVVRRAPVMAQGPDGRDELLVIGDHRAAVTEGAEVLGRVEAERRCRAPRPHPAVAERGTVGLGRVLDDGDAGAVAAAPDLGHRRGPPVQVDGDDRGGARGDGRRECGGIHAARDRVDVDEDRRRAGRDDRLGRREERVRRRDHLRAGPRADGPKRERECVRATGDAGAVPRAAEGRELLLEARELLPERERPGRRRTRERVVQAIGDGRMHPSEIEQRNHPERPRVSPPAARRAGVGLVIRARPPLLPRPVRGRQMDPRAAATALLLVALGGFPEPLPGRS